MDDTNNNINTQNFNNLEHLDTDQGNDTTINEKDTRDVTEYDYLKKLNEKLSAFNNVNEAGINDKEIKRY